MNNPQLKTGVKTGTIARYIDPVAGFRATFVDASGPMQEMQGIQKLLPASAILLGRAACGASLLASQLDEGEVISLYFRGDGPMEFIFAECSQDGKVRAYTPHPDAVPLVAGEIDLKGALGKGTLTVVRTHPAKPAPYRGTSELKSGLIGEDIAHYLQQSEQSQALISLGVRLDSNGNYQGACGIFIEMLPGAPTEFAEILEENFRNAEPLSEKLAKLSGEKLAESVLSEYLANFRPRVLSEPSLLEFFCPCSKERLIRSMRMFSVAELDEIVNKKETTKAKCEFCGRSYELEWQIVKDIRDGKHKTDLH